MALNTLPNAGLTSRGYPSDRLVTPIIINGDMSVAQRATSKAVADGTSGMVIDRYRPDFNLGGFTMSQSTTVPSGQGFGYSLKLDCTTADASPASGDVFFLAQRIEGQNLQMLKFGTSSAEKTTLSFWVRSNLTGRYQVNMRNQDASTQHGGTYTISSANTWEKKIINFNADTSNAFSNDNGESMRLEFCLGVGSDYTSGTFPTTWSGNLNNNARGVRQDVNLASSTSNEWYITGIQIEVGEFDSTSIPSFPFESFSNSLLKCQRYYHKTYDDTTAPGTSTTVGAVQTGTTATSTYVPMQYFYPVRMRSAPTFTAYSPATGTSGKFASNAPSGDHNIGTGRIGVSNANFSSSTTSVSATGYIEAHFEADSEL